MYLCTLIDSTGCLESDRYSSANPFVSRSNRSEGDIRIIGK